MTKLAITPGDPRGIGFEILLKAAQQPLGAELFVFADETLLKKQAKELKLEASLEKLNVHHILCNDIADYVLTCIREAVHACQNKACDALVTGPIHKATIIEAGHKDFSGHTDFLKELDQADDVVMMLASEACRVALITTHIPLNQVANSTSEDLIVKKIKLLSQELKNKLGLTKPKILVSGLNPHAGEDGHLGSEEQTIIAPALETLKQSGIDVTGPLSADTLFTPPFLKQADVFVTMYHDQGLAPFKALSFHQSVNITLGLSFLRTSVDHGTAFNIAGQGIADAGSMVYAIRQAIKSQE